MLKRRATPHIILMALVLMCLSLSSPGYSLPSDADKAEIEKLLALLELQRQQIEEQQKAILAQEQRLAEYQKATEERLAEQQISMGQLKSQLNATSVDKQAAVKEPSSPQPNRKQQTNATPANTEPIKPVGRPPEPSAESRPPEVAAIFDQPGVLTPKGSLILEPSVQYSHSSNKRISLHGYTIIPAVTIGLIDVLSINRNTYLAALSSRYGLTNRLELELKIPYVYRTETSSTRYFATDSNTENKEIDGNGLGDIEFGLRYQLNQPKNGAYYVANLRVKSDTGTDPFEVDTDAETKLPTELTTGSGFWSVQPSITAILPSDPAVFFGSISYLWNIERNIGEVHGTDYGRLDPGDAFGFNFGMGLALNEKASFSMGYDHSIITKTKQNGKVLDDQVIIHVGSFQLGYSYRLVDKLSLNLSLGIGVTEEAPDVQLTLKLPITF